MSVDEAYTMSYVNVESANTADTSFDLTQLQSWSPSPNVREQMLSGAGELDPTYQTTQSVDPVVSLTTSELATVLSNCGILGVAIDRDDGTSDPGMEFYLKQLENEGGRLTGSNHVMGQISEGILVPRTLNASQDGGPATIQLDAIARGDGVNAPIIWNEGASISVTPSASVSWVLGKVEDASGTDLEATDVTIDFGLNEQKLSNDGDVAPTHVSIMSRQPSIRLTVQRSSYLATVGDVGTNINPLTIYLRKTDEHGKRIGDATGEHIQLQARGTLRAQPTTFNQQQPAALDLMMQPTYDGTNDIIAITTSTTIT